MVKDVLVVEALAEMQEAVDHLDSAYSRLCKADLEDKEQLDRLNSAREQLNGLLTEMEDKFWG